MENKKRNGGGNLFRNLKKFPNDSKPNYTGVIEINDTRMFAAVWIRETKKGDNYLNLSLTEIRKPEEIEL